MKLNSLMVIVFLCMTFNTAFAKEVSESFQPVVIEGAHQRLIKSQEIDQEYKLLVSLPRNYERSNKRYPVVYLLDAQWDFAMFVSLYGQLYFDGDVPDLILVGVTWGGENPNAGQLRLRDFSPTNVTEMPSSGKADQFLRFFKKQVFPFVDQEYRSNDERILVGSSLGGLFTMYTMFTQPELFDKYIPSATAAQWDDEVILDYAKKYVKKRINKPIKMYSGVGADDFVNPSLSKLQTYLEQEKPIYLDMKFETFPKLSHSASKSFANIRGLQYLFAKTEVLLSDAQLQPFTGSYKDKNGTEVTVAIDNGRLVFTDPTGSKDYLKAMSENEFFLQGVFMKMKFETSKKPIVATITLFEGDLHFTKVETPASN